MKQLSPFLILVMILCAGCPRPLFLPDRNLKDYVRETDVIGAWNLQQESLDLLIRDGFATNASHQYHIQFLTNGICVFQSVADKSIGGEYYDVQGTWKLEHDTTGGSNFGKKNAIRLELPLPNTTHLSYLNLDKRDNALVLWSFYGDPDSWEFIEYMKQNNAFQAIGDKSPQPER